MRVYSFLLQLMYFSTYNLQYYLYLWLLNYTQLSMQICPVCTLWIGTNMVHHIAAQHGNLLKISFLVYCLIEMFLFIQNKQQHQFAAFVSSLPESFFCSLPFIFIPLCTSFTGDYSHLKSKCYKDEPYPALSFSSKGERDGHWQSFSTGLSPTTSKAASDPWLSFLCGPSAVDECENVQPDSSSEVSIEEIHSNDNVLERYDEVSLFTMSTMCHITLLMYFPISSQKSLIMPMLDPSSKSLWMKKSVLRPINLTIR